MNSFSRIIPAALLETIPLVAPTIYLIMKNRRYSLPKTYAAFFLLAINFIAANLLSGQFWINYGPPRLFFSALGLGAYTGVLIWLMNERPGICIFLHLYIKNYSDMCSLSTRLIFILVFHVDSRDVIASAGGLAISLAVLLCTFLLFLRSLDRILACTKKTGKLSFWRYLWLIPGAFYFIFRFGVYPDYLFDALIPIGEVLFFSLVYSFCIFLSYFLIIKMMNVLTEYEDTYAKLQAMETMVTLQNKSYLALQNNMESVRTARHDLRHHLIVIDRYAQEGDLKQLQEYIRPLMSSKAVTKTVFYCENPSVDAVVSYFAGIAESIGVPFHPSIQLPGELPIPELDFCTILGNLLENAVEACQKQTSDNRSIQLNISLAGAAVLLLAVSNTYEQPVRVEGGSFLSSKHPGVGIGTSSVRHLAERYLGVANFEYTGGVFQASVLLNPAKKARRDSSPGPAKECVSPARE